MPMVLTTYGGFGLLLILFSGSMGSSDRYAFGVVSSSVAIAYFLSHHPQLGRAVLASSAIVLLILATKFAQNQWVS